ncbi:hypothetical protein B0H17DRAFT_1135049 [Mycena rosella]|uniref:Uncharacterized protein n=1 Tax=Mycena rosella TaxID=1033263 RepID=A0AAD7DE41_MYCRO|nr:hypothetical protein B0H17DRAFT_1135049 [Mycena rosella]
MSHNGFGSRGPVPSSRHQLSVPADSWTRVKWAIIFSRKFAITCDGAVGKRSNPSARGRRRERAWRVGWIRARSHVMAGQASNQIPAHGAGARSAHVTELSSGAISNSGGRGARRGVYGRVGCAQLSFFFLF